MPEFSLGSVKNGPHTFLKMQVLLFIYLGTYFLTGQLAWKSWALGGLSLIFIFTQGACCFSPKSVELYGPVSLVGFLQALKWKKKCTAG